MPPSVEYKKQVTHLVCPCDLDAMSRTGFFIYKAPSKMPYNAPRKPVDASKIKNSIILLPKRFECVIAKILQLGNYGKIREISPNLFHTLQNKNVAL